MRNRRWPPHESSPVGGLLHVERPILPRIERSGGPGAARAHTISYRRQRHAGNRLKLRQYKNYATQAHMAIWAIWPALAGATPQFCGRIFPMEMADGSEAIATQPLLFIVPQVSRFLVNSGVSHDLWGDTNGDGSRGWAVHSPTSPPIPLSHRGGGTRRHLSAPGRSAGTSRRRRAVAGSATGRTSRTRGRARAAGG